MSRSQRLLDLIQLLRRHRRPVAGAVLADELGVSLRTLYRDVESLKAQGAHIEGEAGLGYVLRPGFLLPPLMLSEEEIEALVLGSRWVAERADGELGRAARDLLAKIGAVLPPPLRDGMDANGLLIAPGQPIAARDAELAAVRRAIRTERKVRLAYADEHGAITERVVWPVAVGFYDRSRTAVAWCELRSGFRHFRMDRIQALEVLVDRYSRRRAALLKQWREERGVPEQ